jgi:hypothetical protein
MNKEKEMNAHAMKWRNDEGSIDFIQVVVGLLIISIASIGTLQALYYGYEQLDYQMRYKKAVSLARAYTEYIQGRIHVELDKAGQPFFAGNFARPQSWILDRRDPSRLTDDIYCDVSYGQVAKIDDPATGEGYDFYRFVVKVSWIEPTEVGTGAQPHEIELAATMVEAAI